METATMVAALEWNLKSRRAILARVNRTLAHRGEKLICGVGRERERVGGWYRVHEGTGRIVAVFLDLEDTARSLGVLEPWEKLEPSEKVRSNDAGE